MSSVRDSLPIQGLSRWYRESGFPHRKPGLLQVALEALTTSCGKHPNEVVDSAAKVIHVPERHIVPCVEREAFLPAQGNSHFSSDLVTSVRFSEAMYDTYRQMVGESVFY
jgi:hypothetical protein